MAHVAVPRVFRRLVEDRTITARPSVLSKGTLTELSHVLENAVIEHDLPGAVFTGFQESGNWLRALDRYERLVAPKARSVAVFARGNVASLEPDGIVRVRLEDHSPLVEEWFLIVLTPRFSAALLGEDSGAPAQVEADRLFDAIWTFEPTLITAIVERIAGQIEDHDAAAAEAMRTALTTYPPVGRIGPIHDEVMTRIVTALERSRDRLRRAAQLEQIVADELRHLDRTKNVFLSAVSHELRTPLTVVKGLAETLQRLGDDLREGDRTRIVDAISDNATRLARLLDDLLDVDRLVRGTLVAQRVHFDASELVREQLAASPIADRVVLRAPGTLPVEADPVQLERIVANLLENVRKYAPSGEVQLRLTALPDHGCRVEVEDRGPGIDAEDLDLVFRPFHRGNDDHPSPGTGIGLALVAEFAALHGGRAWAEDPGHGARVVVELPGPSATDPGAGG